MFTTFADPYLEKEALTAGVHAVIDKSEGAVALLSCIRQLFLSGIADSVG